MYEQEDMVVKLSSRMPPQFVGRVEKKHQATLVIKSVIFEDSTYYRCQLEPKVGLVNESYILLVVTGMLINSVLCSICDWLRRQLLKRTDYESPLRHAQLRFFVFWLSPLKINTVNTSNPEGVACSINCVCSFLQFFLICIDLEYIVLLEKLLGPWKCLDFEELVLEFYLKHLEYLMSLQQK